MRLLAFQERAEGLFLLFTGTAGGGSGPGEIWKPPADADQSLGLGM